MTKEAEIQPHCFSCVEQIEKYSMNPKEVSKIYAIKSKKENDVYLLVIITIDPATD